MDDDDVAWVLGRDPSTALGYLLACVVAAVIFGALYEANVAYSLGEALPMGWEWVPFAALHLALSVSVAAGAGYHAASNRGYATVYAGAFVALYGPAYAVAPLNLGGGFPGAATVYEAAAEAAAIAVIVGMSLATVGTLLWLALDRHWRAPPGSPMAATGRAAAAPLPGGARPAVVAVALLVVLSAGVWVATAPAIGDRGAPCAGPATTPDIAASHADDTLRVTYEHDCGLQASSLVFDVDGRRMSWADAAPAVGAEETLARGASVTVSAPANATVTVVYDPGDGDGTLVLYRENASGDG